MACDQSMANRKKGRSRQQAVMFIRCQPSLATLDKALIRAAREIGIQTLEVYP